MDATGNRSGLNRRGQAMAEYAMLVAIVGMGLVVILGLFGRATKHAWQQSESRFADEPTASTGAPSAPVGGGGGASAYVPPPSAPSAPAAPSESPKGDSPDSTSGSESPDSLGAPGGGTQIIQ